MVFIRYLATPERCVRPYTQVSHTQGRPTLVLKISQNLFYLVPTLFSRNGPVTQTNPISYPVCSLKQLREEKNTAPYSEVGGWPTLVLK